jgi:hypothetical protein
MVGGTAEIRVLMFVSYFLILIMYSASIWDKVFGLFWFAWCVCHVGYSHKW